MQIGSYECVGFFFGEKPGSIELSYYIEECRVLRALAIKRGLNPDTALPEDILLLNETEEGALAVFESYKEAVKALEVERHERKRGLKKKRSDKNNK